MKKKTIVSFILIMSLLLPKTIFANSIETTDEKDKIIQELLDVRAAALNDLFINGVSKESIQAVDAKLTQLGVEFLSEKQVYEQFPETKNDKRLALGGMTQRITNNGSRVSTPTSQHNTWASYRSTYTTGGITYNVQRLIAQPSTSNSPLTNIGTRTITFSRNWIAGVNNAIYSLGQSAVGMIPGSTVALTFYDAVKSFISGISTTTEVSVPHIAYSWSNVTTAVFTYVRQNSQGDESQWLSMISTKTHTVVAYNIPTFNYRTINGSWGLSPQIIQGNRNIYCTPSGYDSISMAVEAYRSSGSLVRNAVSNIQISGPESQSIQTIWPCYPNFPAQCE